MAQVGDVVRIGRREFRVAEIAEKGDCERPLYILEGARGARYATMRNVHRPELMFLVHSGRGFGMVKAYESTRLTDKTGALEVL